MIDNAIHIESVSKTFGGVKALDNISLDINHGEIYGLLGPDGAGKTTLFRILTTLMLPDSGTASVCGFDTIKNYTQIRRISGYMPGRFSLYPDLSVEENLKFFASLFGEDIADNFDIIEPIFNQLAPFKNRRAANLSGGMKQKLALCCSLIHRPEILFLDEPTTGLHFEDINVLLAVINRLADKGNTIVVIEHNLDVIKSADYVIDLGPEGGRDGGLIIAQGTPEEVAETNTHTAVFLKKELQESARNQSTQTSSRPQKRRTKQRADTD